MTEYEQNARMLLAALAAIPDEEMRIASTADVLRAAQVTGMRRASDELRKREYPYPAVVVKMMADALDKASP
jgi:hypothetical protein